MGEVYPFKAETSTTSAQPASKAGKFKYPLTDSGNAERLVERYGKDFRFCKAKKGWLIYDESRWKPDETDFVQHRAKLTARKIIEEMTFITDHDDRTELAKHARKSESRRSLEAMVKLAQSDPQITVDVTKLDADPWLLNVINGTIDLRSGKLGNHRRSDLITKLAPVIYDEHATCPQWLKFLERVQPDHEVRAFLQRFVGYALTGVIREHVLPINYGSGRNGKGVFVDTILHVMGEYARQIPTELLVVKRFDAHPTERATLLGCRFAAAVETEQERDLNVALVKQLTGGDRISARYMRQDFFEFTPAHKLMLSTNHKPVIRETKNAIWDRVKLIPWDVTIPEQEQDKELKEKLVKNETAGILRWAVDGCLAWQAEGLNPPAAVRVATDAYRDAQDFISDFLEDCCIEEKDEKVSATRVYEAYKRWCIGNGETIHSQLLFAERMAEKEFEKGKSNGLKVYRGLQLKEVAEQPL